MADPRIRVEVRGLDEVQDLLARLPDLQFTSARKEFQKSALNVHAAVSARITSGTPLHSRTGNLRRSLRFGVSGNNMGELQSFIYSDMVYAPIQETGAQGDNAIKAKRAYSSVPGGPYLNIPLSPNKTPAGVTRMQAREVFNAGGYLVQARSGKWLVRLNDQNMFVLKKEIEFPPRLGMFDAADDEVPHLLSRLAQVPLDG